MSNIKLTLQFQSYPNVNTNTHITNHGKVRSGTVDSQYNHVKILELGTGLDGWGYAMIIRGLSWELRSTIPMVR